jgi:hypothetical protein
MPKPQESRAIHHFIREYNKFGSPQISSWQTDITQESPDAVLTLSNRQKVALEHTSAFPPKHSRVEYTSPRIDLSPIHKVLNRKLLNHYREHGQDQLWLLMQIRPTLPLDLVVDHLKDTPIPSWYDAVFLQWPILLPKGPQIGIYELRKQCLWVPDYIAA